jgi:MFS family permease
LLEIEEQENILHSQESNKNQNWEQFSQLFSPDLWQTTVLVWLIWIFVSFGYTMFNGFLTKFLEFSGGQKLSESDLYLRYMIVSLFGIPGSIAGWYAVDSRLGRKGTMAVSTFGTALALYLSTLFTSSTGQIISDSVASFLQNIMWGVIYAYSPEVFPTRCRGTGVGMAASLSRIFGAIAPLVTGALFSIKQEIPLYVAAASLTLAGFCMIVLPIETRGRVTQ